MNRDLKMKTSHLSIIFGILLGSLVVAPVNADSNQFKKEQRSEQRQQNKKEKHQNRSQKQYRQDDNKASRSNQHKQSRNEYRKENRSDKNQHDKVLKKNRYETKNYKTRDRYPRHEHSRSGYSKDRYYPNRRHDYRDYRHDRRHYEYRRGHRLLRLTPRHRVFRNIFVIRPFGHSYYGYGHYLNDHSAWKWLTFTAITLKLLDMVDEQAQREHEAAQIAATTAEIGERIYWDTDDASGYVEATRQGTSSKGLQCREYQHSITVGGETEEAYGTACLQPDGSWKVLN